MESEVRNVRYWTCEMDRAKLVFQMSLTKEYTLHGKAVFLSSWNLIIAAAFKV